MICRSSRGWYLSSPTQAYPTRCNGVALLLSSNVIFQGHDLREVFAREAYSTNAFHAVDWRSMWFISSWFPPKKHHHLLLELHRLRILLPNTARGPGLFTVLSQELLVITVEEIVYGRYQILTFRRNLRAF